MPMPNLPSSWNEMSLRERLQYLRTEKRLNILPGQRVGWEQKTELLHELAELSAEGYLSLEEWEIRKKHVEEAQLREQLDLVMMDLQHARREVARANDRRERAAKERKELAEKSNSPVRKNPTAFLFSMPFYLLMWMLALLSSTDNVITHDMLFGGIAIAGLFIWTVLIIAKLVNRNGT